MKSLAVCSFLVFAMAGSGRLNAADWGLEARGGLMQQPGSEYYHAVNGGAASVWSSQKKIGVEVEYWERPEFRSQGFIDQEFSSSVKALFAIREGKNWLWQWGVGAGEVHGFTAVLEEDGLASRKSRFAIGGLVSEWNLKWTLGDLMLGLSHEVTIGFGPKIEREAYVAWPYQTILTSLGYRL